MLLMVDEGLSVCADITAVAVSVQPPNRMVVPGAGSNVATGVEKTHIGYSKFAFCGEPSSIRTQALVLYAPDAKRAGA